MCFYCQSCDKLIYLPLWPGTDDVSQDVMVGGQYSIPYMLLLLSFKVFISSVLWSRFFRMGLPVFHAWWLLLCCQIWNIHKLIIRWTLDSFQVNLNCNYWILFRTCEDVLADAGDLGGDFLRSFAPVLTGSRLWASSQASSRCSSG